MLFEQASGYPRINGESQASPAHVWGRQGDSFVYGNVFGALCQIRLWKAEVILPLRHPDKGHGLTPRFVSSSSTRFGLVESRLIGNVLSPIYANCG